LGANATGVLRLLKVTAQWSLCCALRGRA